MSLGRLVPCLPLVLLATCFTHDTTHLAQVKVSVISLTTQQNTTQHNTTKHNTTQHNTTQHNTTQHNTTQHNTTQHNTTQHNTTQHNITLRKRIEKERQRQNKGKYMRESTCFLVFFLHMMAVVRLTFHNVSIFAFRYSFKNFFTC